MGSQAGYGNVIILRHAAGLTTLYGHMSGFAPHLQKGSSVDQGEVIGYVGMTGLATGPHVHYEFRVNGVFRDPLSVSLPVAVSLSAEQKISFLQSVAPHVQLLEKLRGLSASNFD
jgi:murein DD-endopeptidase MepM/ murein hydrolase activator NlpD